MEIGDPDERAANFPPVTCPAGERPANVVAERFPASAFDRPPTRAVVG
jgi:hypothetical protein